MRELPAVALRRGGVFTLAEALAAGWTEAAIRHALAGKVLHRVGGGVYALPPAAGPEAEISRVTQLAVGSSLAVRDNYVSHLAAARMRRWRVWAPAPRPCVTRASGGQTSTPGVHVHRSALLSGDLVRRGDLVLTAPGRTLVDIAREFGTEAALVSADDALRRRDIGLADLHAAITAGTGRTGAPHARALLGSTAPRSESALETRSRWQLRRHGLPHPLTQVELFDLTGRFLGRVDFFWPEFGVVGEADGDLKYTDGEVFKREKRRERGLERTRLIVERWGWADVNHFGPTADLLREDFERGTERRETWRWWADLGSGPTG